MTALKMTGIEAFVSQLPTQGFFYTLAPHLIRANAVFANVSKKSYHGDFLQQFCSMLQKVAARIGFCKIALIAMNFFRSIEFSCRTKNDNTNYFNELLGVHEYS